MRSGVIALAALLGTAAATQAGELMAAGAIYGGPAQARAVCYVYNAGTHPSASRRRG